MASNTDYLPDEITYGFVADRVLLAIGDTASDDDRYPDGVPAQGTVRFSPERTILYTQQHPATVLPQDIECTIYYRDHPVAKEHGYEPEHVGKLVDPAGHVGNVALIVGWYEVVYRLSTGTAQRFRFQVRPEHTNDDPLWLPEVAPLSPTPSERFVVNEQVYNDTKAARDATQGYRDEAQAARTEATDARDEAETFRDALADHVVHIDNSVGTRVFVGDTMIHGETGWRDIGLRLLDGWTPAANRVLIMREGNDVTLRLDSTRTSDASTFSNILDIPPGFNPAGRARIAPVFITSSKQGWLDNISGPLRIRDLANALSAGDRITTTVKWVTTDPWPTSLPGTPA